MRIGVTQHSVEGTRVFVNLKPQKIIAQLVSSDSKSAKYCYSNPDWTGILKSILNSSS